MPAFICWFRKVPAADNVGTLETFPVYYAGEMGGPKRRGGKKNFVATFTFSKCLRVGEKCEGEASWHWGRVATIVREQYQTASGASGTGQAQSGWRRRWAVFIHRPIFNPFSAPTVSVIAFLFFSSTCSQCGGRNF